MKGGVRGGQAAVKRRMHQDFFELFARDAVVEGGSYMHFQFSFAIKAINIAMVIRLRVWRDRPGRVHISPQA